MTSTDKFVTITTLDGSTTLDDGTTIDGSTIKDVPVDVVNRIELLKNALEMYDIGNDDSNDDSNDSEQIVIPMMHQSCTKQIMTDIIRYTKLEIENETSDLMFRKEHQISVEDSEYNNIKELPHNHMMDWSEKFMISLVHGDPDVIDAKDNSKKFTYLLEVFKMVFYMNQTNMVHEAAKYIASLISKKSTPEIRQTFDLVNDFTPELQKEADGKFEFLLKIKPE
jgi:hypothetical protein